MYHGMSHQLINFLLCRQEGCSMCSTLITDRVSSGGREIM